MSNVPVLRSKNKVSLKKNQQHNFMSPYLRHTKLIPSEDIWQAQK